MPRRDSVSPHFLDRTAKVAKVAKDDLTRRETEKWAREVVDSALLVHSALGPGLLESAYVHCLAFELRARGLAVIEEVPMPVAYRGNRLDVGYRIDLLVNEAIVVEVKAVASLRPIHQAQLLSYLRLSDLRVGFLINFHEERLKNGLRRIVNNW